MSDDTERDMTARCEFCECEGAGTCDDCFYHDTEAPPQVAPAAWYPDPSDPYPGAGMGGCDVHGMDWPRRPHHRGAWHLSMLSPQITTREEARRLYAQTLRGMNPDPELESRIDRYLEESTES